MDDHSFHKGQEVKALFWSDEGEITVGRKNVERITVVMEHGQISRVPWFAVRKDGKITKYNGAMLEGVEL